MHSASASWRSMPGMDLSAAFVADDTVLLSPICICNLFRSQGCDFADDTAFVTGHALHRGLRAGRCAALHTPSARPLMYARSCANVSRYHVELH